MNTRGYVGMGLYQPKTNANVGSVLRAAQCYDASFVAIEGRRYHRSATDTMKGYRHVPLFSDVDLLSMIPFDCVPVAIEFIKDAQPLHTYVHPERAFYIFGPEDGSVPSRILEKCRDVVYVPTEFCMNLAATANVVLYDRRMKQLLENKNEIRSE